MRDVVVVGAAHAVLERYDEAAPIKVGTGVDVTIRELAETIASVVGLEGELVWTPRSRTGRPASCST